METRSEAIGALANAGERMADLFGWLNGQDCITHATRSADIRRYVETSALEMYVEGETVDGKGLGYALEVYLRAGTLEVEASSFLQLADGQVPLRSTAVVVPSDASMATVLDELLDAFLSERDDDLRKLIAQQAP